MGSGVSWDLDPFLNKHAGEMVGKGDTPLEAAKKIADAAKDIALTEAFDTGEYHDGIVAIKTKGGARVMSFDYYSTFIEFGAPNHGIEPKYIFRRAAEAVGLSFKTKKR